MRCAYLQQLLPVMALGAQMLSFASVLGGGGGSSSSGSGGSSSSDSSSFSFCSSREVGCSGHGECNASSACLCDPGYDGERCDVWRAPVSPSLLANVDWLNCTHGRPAGNGSTVVQLCTLDEKGVCEAAGAPTVPPPDWDGVCFDKPTKPRSYGKSVCQPDIEGIATVVKGLSGSFCAMPCITKSQASCEGCPDDGCQVKNATTGQCVRCASSCKDQPEFHSAPCDAREEMVCPCGGGTDAAGQPLLARPQCVVTDCGPYPNDLQRRPLCALTCDPDAAVPPGRHKCQPGATCERVPNASFTPAGICTWPMDNTIAPYVPGVPSSSEPKAQMEGWSWGAAHGATGSNTCPAIHVPRYSCVANSSTSKAYCVPLGNSTHYFTYPTMGAEGDPPCGGHCSVLPPNADPPLMPPHCHPAPTPPPPPPQLKFMCDTVGHNCFPTPAGNWSKEYSCTAACAKPTPPPPPPPPPPLGSSPCIRFVHALPVNHRLDVIITQDQSQRQQQEQQEQQEQRHDGDASASMISHSWNNYAFANYSNWVNVFKSGSGTLTLFENIGGQRGSRVLLTKEIPLTPGPLVVAVKVALNQDPSDPSKYWPPNEPDQIETIAASYPPTTGQASVRLFNLSPDTKAAGMSSDGAGAVGETAFFFPFIENNHFAETGGTNIRKTQKRGCFP
jgi:hypothetical protein